MENLGENLFEAGSENFSATSTVKPDSIVLEFLEVCIHQLLYIYEIYPSGIFTRKQKYNIPVQVSNHPLVNTYILECLKTAQMLLKRNELTKLIVLFSCEEVPVKQIVFDVSSLQKGISIPRHDEERLEMALRDVFLRLCVSDRRLQRLPPNCTFKILLGTQERSHMALSKDPTLQLNQESFPWLRYQDQRPSSGRTTVIPLSSMAACGVALQVHAEEVVEHHASTATPNVRKRPHAAESPREPTNRSWC